MTNCSTDNIYWGHGAGAKWHGAGTFLLASMHGGILFMVLWPWVRHFLSSTINLTLSLRLHRTTNINTIWIP